MASTRGAPVSVVATSNAATRANATVCAVESIALTVRVRPSHIQPPPRSLLGVCGETPRARFTSGPARFLQSGHRGRVERPHITPYLGRGADDGTRTEAARAFEARTGVKFARIDLNGAGKGLKAALAGEVQVAGVSRSGRRRPGPCRRGAPGS